MNLAAWCCGSWGAGSGSVVTWRRAQMVLLSAQGTAVAMIAQITFTSPDRLYGHITTPQGAGRALAFCRYLRTLHSP